MPLRERLARWLTRGATPERRDMSAGGPPFAGSSMTAPYDGGTHRKRRTSRRSAPASR